MTNADRREGHAVEFFQTQAFTIGDGVEVLRQRHRAFHRQRVAAGAGGLLFCSHQRITPVRADRENEERRRRQHHHHAQAAPTSTRGVGDRQRWQVEALQALMQTAVDARGPRRQTGEQTECARAKKRPDRCLGIEWCQRDRQCAQAAHQRGERRPATFGRSQFGTRAATQQLRDSFAVQATQAQPQDDARHERARPHADDQRHGLQVQLHRRRADRRAPPARERGQHQLGIQHAEHCAE